MKAPRTARAYRRWRNDICRRLDVKEFMDFIVEQHGPQMLVAPDVPLAAMHKVRLVEPAFTEKEKAASRQWLKEHDYKEDIR